MKTDLFAQWEYGDKPLWKLPDCLQGFVKGTRDDGTTIFKAVACGKEWCEECGKNDSWVHTRRVARWTGKGFAWIHDNENVGYLVVTMPPEFWPYLRTKPRLNEIRTFWRRKLKRHGYTVGLGSWHTHGSCQACKGREPEVQLCRVCHHTGAGRMYKPHLNLLFQEGYLPKETLKAWRKEFQSWLTRFGKKHKLPINVRTPVLNYQYSQADDPLQPSKVWHWLKYVTRSTHRIWDRDLAERLKGYRIRFTWGNWKQKQISDPWIQPIFDRISPSEMSPDEKKTRHDLTLLSQKVCPFTGQRINWEKFSSESAVAIYRITNHVQQYIRGGFFFVRE